VDGASAPADASGRFRPAAAGSFQVRAFDFRGYLALSMRFSVLC